MTFEPADENELAAFLAEARDPLAIRGGGTRLPWLEGEPLSTRALTGVVLYEPEALTLVVRAGTPLAEVEAVLAERGQRLAFEPPDMRPLLGTTGEPTIGGAVASNASGPRRVQAGACRDFLLGVRFVDGRGRIVANGGRVMKNVTGYDLVKLMAGSHGTLGVLTELSFKVQALPEAEATLIARGKDAQAGVAALCRALGSPHDVSGVAHAQPGVLEDDALTLLRVEGMARSVRYRAEQLGGGEWELVEGAASAELWRRIRDVAPFAGRAGAVWRIAVNPTDGPVLLQGLRDEGVEHKALLDWGGGLVWLLVEDAGDAGARAIRARVTRLGGHARLVRASAETRARVPLFQPQPPQIARLEAGIRAKYDPRGILNPGLMG